MFFLFFVYFKPKDSSRQDLDNELDCFDKLINQIAYVSDRGNIIVAGDLNSRVAGKKQNVTLMLLMIVLMI